MVESKKRSNFKEKIGILFRIPLEENKMYAYGQIATKTKYIFFDHYDRENEWTNPNIIVEKPVAFYATVDRYVLKEGLWDVLDIYPVKEENKFFPCSFGYDMFKNTYYLWKDNPEKGRPDHIPCSLEETYGHEYLTSYGHGSIEQRLRDHFANRPNYDVVHDRLQHLKQPSMQYKDFYAQYGYNFHWLDEEKS